MFITPHMWYMCIYVLYVHNPHMWYMCIYVPYVHNPHMWYMCIYVPYVHNPGVHRRFYRLAIKNEITVLENSPWKSPD